MEWSNLLLASGAINLVTPWLWGRDDHGADVQEWTPVELAFYAKAGVGLKVLSSTRSTSPVRSQY